MIELQTKLSRLKVWVAEADDGEFVAYSTSEPLFCFSRPTEKEALEIADAAIRSYARVFFHVELPPHGLEPTEEVAPPVPVRRVAPTRYTRAKRDWSFPTGPVALCA